MSQAQPGYDLIGDIHGEYPALVSLLSGMGYAPAQGVWRHPERKVIFLGDFIDRGRYQCEVLDLVRAMVDEGQALAVMGNHEFNALAYYTEDGAGDYLRPHSPRNRNQHRAFLDVYEPHPHRWKAVVEWFRGLPLWLELDGLRVVHACWDRAWIRRLEQEHRSNRLTEELLYAASQKERWEYQAIETLLKGREIPLPDGHPGFTDKDGTQRHHIRIRWWDASATRYRQAFMGPADAATHIPDDPIEGDHLVDYGATERPVFLGHYWLVGNPAPLAPNVACLDYSVAKPGGKLVAYRWDGEQELRAEKFFWSTPCATNPAGRG